MSLKILIKETRPQFLILSPVLVLLGTSVAYSQGYFDWMKFILASLGLVLAHASVNVLNDYFDYRSGIDVETTPTPFSGGSGILPKGLLEPKQVYVLGLATLGGAFLIGLYLTLVSSWQLLVLVLIGGLVIYYYTSFLTKWLVGELWAGLGLGTLPVIGTYFIQTGRFNPEILIVSVVPGLLTANLLFLNEFPDFDADRKGGRFHLVIALGRRRAAVLYTGLVFLTYVCIIAGVVSRAMPAMSLIALITAIFAYKAVSVASKNYDKPENMIPALKFNVMMILGTDVLLSLGYFLSR